MRAVFYNGIFTDFESASIPLCDRSVFFGDGVYDVLIGTENSLYLADWHLDRFYSNIEKIGLKPYCERGELLSLIKKLVSISGEPNFLLYMQSSARSPSRTHARCGTESNLLLCIFPYEIKEEFLSVRLRTSPDLRGNMCDVKSINLLPAVLASTKAQSEGLDECIYVRRGIVTECAHSSLAIVKNGVLITHPLSEAILPGITRRRALYFLSKAGIPYTESAFRREALYTADEVLIFSTTKFCRWASEIDGVRFSKKKAEIGQFLLRNLLKDYQNL